MNMEEFAKLFFKLPADLQILIVNEYVDPYVSILFLRVCKPFHKKLNRDLIIYRYLKQKSYDEYLSRSKNVIFCEICNLHTEDKNIMRKHMDKHKNNPNKKFQMFKKLHPCELCEAPKGYGHKCLLREKTCPREHIPCIYKWVELIGCKRKIYEIEPHSCNYKCRECKEVFSDGDKNIGKGVNKHFKTCSKKLNMVSKYGIRKKIGDKYVCYYCDGKKYEEENTCTCLCRECKSDASNKVVIRNERNEIIEIYFICYKCAKCAKCGENWNNSGMNKIWHYEDLPYCEKCSL